MRVSVSIALFLALIGCDGRPLQKAPSLIAGRTWSIELDSNIGTVQITLPERYDTLLKWTQYSDCGDGCAKIDYRVQPKQLKIYKESGFYWIEPKDSIEQFTIKHPKQTVYGDSNSANSQQDFLALLKAGAYKNIDRLLIIDTIVKVGELTIAAIAYQHLDTLNNSKTQILDAITAIHGNQVRLSFENRKRYQDSLGADFIKNSFHALQSLQLSNSR